ncbi:thioesterase family protein [Chitinivorax sp. PXF-14]|uniref:acyl-CoA thioesterase n=1 Tax=Chitinivorax sp. PXF-14 TaxID=3230488 RepID=UPI003465A98D
MTHANRIPAHIAHITMRWGDMDALGHLNNTYYFRYMEQARLDWLDSHGCGINPQATGPVIAHISCDFKKEIVYPAVVEVHTFVTHIGRSSMKIDHEFRVQGDTETLYATGHAVLVWVDYVNGGSVPVPEAMRAAIPGAAT